MDQTKLLFDILERNAGTDFGKRYAFGNMRTIQAFQNNVPVTNYDSYSPMIELMTRLGEYSIFTAHDLECYALFLGFQWRTETLPCTKEYSQLCFDAMSDFLTGRENNLILFSSLPKKDPSRDGLYTDSIYGIVLEKWREWRKHSFTAKLLGYGQSVLPDGLLFPVETGDHTYAKALLAMADEHVTQIIAQDTWNVLDFIRYIRNHWTELLNDLESGSINDGALPEELRRELRGKWKRDPERVRKLRDLQGPFRLKAVWPELRRIAADGSGRMKLYTEQVREFAPDVEIDFGCSLSAESIYAKNIPGTDLYTLLDQMNFYEFLPADKMWEPHIEEFLILPDQLQEGEYYEMFVTTPYGFYRYRLGEVIRIEKRTQDTVLFTREYSNTDVVRFMGSCITQKQFSDAVLETEKQTGLRVEDFFCLPEENCMLLLIESENRAGHSLTDTAEVLDAALKNSCKEYAALRETQKCGCVRVLWLQPQTQTLLRDYCRFKKIVPDDLYRPVRCPGDPALRKALLALTDEE